MKLGHAFALVSVGWYLMVPPRHQSETISRFWYGQFADWNIVNSFDSAKECEDYRRQMVAAAEKAVPPPPPGFKLENPPSEYPPADAQALPEEKLYSPSTGKTYSSFPTAICIASDDPRLTK